METANNQTPNLNNQISSNNQTPGLVIGYSVIGYYLVFVIWVLVFAISAVIEVLYHF